VFARLLFLLGEAPEPFGPPAQPARIVIGVTESGAAFEPIRPRVEFLGRV
jgi:hypothetical protein